MISQILDIAPWAVFAGSFAVLLILTRWRLPEAPWAIFMAGFVWVLLVQGDSILLGPRARIEWGDGELLFLGYFHHLAGTRNALFLPDLMGGVDRFAFGRIGGELFSLRLLLIDFLPTWAVVVVLRVAATTTALVSVYLLATRRLGCPPALAFAFGALFAAGFDVNATMTFLYTISIAALPALFHLLARLDRRAGPYLGFGVFAVIYVSLADPFFWLPMIWLIAILLPTWHRPNSYIAYFGGLVLLTILWLVNYSEAIFAVLQTLTVSSRPDDFLDKPFIEHLRHQIGWMLSPDFQYNRGGWPYIVPVVFALLVAWRTRSGVVLLSALSAIIVGFATPFLLAVPWGKLQLDFLESYRWYFEYGAFAVAAMAGAQAGAVLANKATARSRVRTISVMVALSLAVGLAMLTTFKMNTVLHMATRGNLTVLQDIPNLRTNNWYDGESRVIGVPTRYPTNVSPSYGLPSFDGGATFIPQSTIDYWRQAVLRRGLNISWELPGLPLLTEYMDCCEPYLIEQDISLDMLRVANVGYILSYRALRSDNLTLVSGPDRQTVPGTVTRILGPAAPVSVYALEDPLPRIYGARSVEAVATNQSDTSYADKVRALAPDRIAVVRADNTDGFVAWSANAEPAFRPVRNGFDIDLPVGGAGTILVNVPPLPWWQATGEDGTKLAVLPANITQLAISVPPGQTKVRLRYARPTLYGTGRTNED